ncbi:hypothetical protein LOTGIDRAFT_109772, partial [Lottia gigantea]
PGNCGLYNLGNTCFMNSGLQSLLASDQLVKFCLEALVISPELQDTLLGRFKTLVMKIWSGEYSVIYPRDFKDTLSLYHNQFQDYRQHDCQEFLALLLDSLHEQLSTVDDIPSVPPVLESYSENDELEADKAWDDYITENNSVVVNSFQGQFKSTIVCSECSHISVTFEPFMYLSLPIPRALERQICNEVLDEQNPWYCPQCRKNQCANKRMTVWRYPDTLIVHLKRFVFHEFSSTKIDNPVIFPQKNLDLTDFLSGPKNTDLQYDLYSVVCHFGGSNSGHYTAYSKHPIYQEWFYYNDETVTKQTPKHDEYSSGYVLFYQKQGKMAG